MVEAAFSMLCSDLHISYSLIIVPIVNIIIKRSKYQSIFIQTPLVLFMSQMSDMDYESY